MIPCESSSSSTRLAPGFRFHPTDEELVSYYLKRKISGLPLRVDAIAEIDLYKKEPWELPSLSKLQTRDMEWYFFSPLDRKDSNKLRTSRGTMEGYWKTTGKDRAVRSTYSNVVVGMKKTLVFHEGRAPKGKRTNWVMHEYRLESSENDAASSCENTALVHPQDSFVVCRIFQKHGSGPQNGAQYGAPFIAEEWEDIHDNKTPECAERHGNGHDAALMCLTNEQYYAELDIDMNQILANHQDNNESTNSKDCQSHADEPTQYQLVDNPVADHLSGEQICDSHAYDISFTLEDLIDFDKPNNIDGNLQENVVCIDGNTARNSSIASDKSDGYLELNDVYANPNGHCTNNTLDDCMRSNHANNANTSLKIEDAEIFNNSNVTTATEGVHSVQPYDYLNPADGNYLEDDTMFYDAPSNDVQFTEDTYMNIKEYNPTVTDFDLVDDLMAFFDATEQNVDPLSADQSDIDNPTVKSEVEGSNYPTGKDCLQTPGANMGMGAPSTEFIDAANPLEKTNVEANDGWNKSFRKHVVDMLGSISAPPAMAAADSCKGKGIQISSSGSSSSIRVSAGMIQIRGISVTGHPEKWTLSKDGEINFIYTYANGAVCKLASRQPPPATVFGALLRSGIFLFGFSVLVLSITMKLGVGVYRK